MTNKSTQLDRTTDLRWYADAGQASLSGDLLEKFEALDQLFLSWAAELGATKHSFPTFIATSDLDKLGYFQSFPHLATFAARVADTPESLNCFSKNPVTPDGCLLTPKLAPISEVLTPAACYHFYINLQKQEFVKPVYLTTRCVCFRRERSYTPLQRQSNFNMREIVCIGSKEEVNQFLLVYRTRLQIFFREHKLPVSLESATDPFFQPMQNPKYLMQKLAPLKTEMVLEDRLAVGSFNLHHDFFGTTFGISRQGVALHSACVAFGLERWLHMLMEFETEEIRTWT